MNREALAPWTSSRHVTHSYRALTLCEPAQAGASNDRRAAAGNEPRQRPTEAGATQLSHLHRTPLGSSRSVMSSTRAIISKRGTLTTLGRPDPNPEEVGCSMAWPLRSGCVDAFDEMQFRNIRDLPDRNPCLTVCCPCNHSQLLSLSIEQNINAHAHPGPCTRAFWGSGRRVAL